MTSKKVLGDQKGLSGYHDDWKCNSCASRSLKSLNVEDGFEAEHGPS